MKKGYIALWIVFVFFLLIKLGNMMTMIVPSAVWSVGLSVFLLIKCGLPKGKHIIISGLSAAAVIIASLLHGIGAAGIIFFGLPTLICSLAVFSVMKKSDDVKMLHNTDKRSVLITVGIGTAVGIVLSLVNTFVFAAGEPFNLQLSPIPVIWALQPGIAEEIVNRAVFAAFCIYLSKGEDMTKPEKFTMYFMMTVPHALAHNYPIPECLLLSVVFGLPFALLQRKRDTVSAIISHTLVDAVRFVIFGA